MKVEIADSHFYIHIQKIRSRRPEHSGTCRNFHLLAYVDHISYLMWHVLIGRQNIQSPP
jgi:hypothetical protein